MTLDFIILLVCSVLITLLGLIILARNPAQPNNRRFAFLSVSLVFWTVFNYLSSTAHENALLFTRLTFLGGILAGVSVLTFIGNFPNQLKFTKSRLRKAHLVFTAMLIPVVFLPQFIESVSVEASGGSITTSHLYNLFIIYALYTIGLILITIRKQVKSAKDANQKQQAVLVSRGIFLYTILAAVSNVLIPLVINNWSSSRFGPVFTLLLVGLVSYTIVKHRLFDIRLVLARTIVYLLSVALIAIVYTVVVFAFGSTVFNLDSVSSSQRAFFACLALLIAATYSPILKFFNRITTRLFFRDAYSSQELLDQVGKIIVGNISTHKIQRDAIKVLEAALKPTYISFLLMDTVKRVRMNGLKSQQWQSTDSAPLQQALKELGTKLTLFDEIGDGDNKIKSALREEDISLVAPLVTKEGMVGYLVAGPKRSGNVYNSQDTGVMSIVANELAIALQNAQRFEEIQAFNVTLQEKVTEATRELKSTNKKLVALDEAKDEFISMASHQLRTPLTSIKGYLSMMVEGDLGKLSAPQEKALKEAFGSSQRMVYLIADFLNVSRIKTGKFLIEPKEVYLPEIVREEILQLGEMTGAKDLKLKYDQPETFPKVMLDDNKIRQVMMNMVDNAIYYTPTGGSITIQLYATADDIIFKVIDTGIGVPKAEQHKLFAKFYRAGNARKARPDGTGLGLFMAQKIVVEQGGAIIFESVEGKGSTFGFRFPLAKIKV